MSQNIIPSFAVDAQWSIDDPTITPLSTRVRFGQKVIDTISNIGNTERKEGPFDPNNTDTWTGMDYRRKAS